MYFEQFAKEYIKYQFVVPSLSITMEPDRAQARSRLMMLLTISLLLLLMLRKSPSPEEVRRSKYGETELEYISHSDPNDNSSLPVLRVHLFKPDSADHLTGKEIPKQPEQPDDQADRTKVD